MRTIWKLLSSTYSSGPFSRFYTALQKLKRFILQAVSVDVAIT